MNILVAIDFSETTGRIMSFVSKLSSEVKMNLFLVHVVQPEPDFIGYKVGPESERDFIAKRFHEKHIQLQELADSFRLPGIPVTPLLIQGPTIQTILEEAEQLKADMIITGSHGSRSMMHLLMGSVSKGLIKNATIPVLVVPSKTG